MADDIKLDLSGIENLLRAMPTNGGRWLTGFAESIVTDIKLSFNTSPPGESYTRGGATHVASQPGYPPNVDIGTLINSIKQENTGSFERTISDGVDYGIKLEDGTEHILPRPFFAPAFARAGERMAQDAKDNLGIEEP
jgi:hypothetical protein